MKLQKLLFTVTIILTFGALNAQCPFEPTVTGDTLLCPDASGILITQEYDSYQWYRREFTNGVPELIPGANGQVLDVNSDDLLYYFWVEATLDNCTEASPEVLVDGFVFLLPFLEHSGDYSFDPNTGSFVICTGDTMFMMLGNPYDANITWYRNGVPIPGENSQQLAVTEAGSYTVEGAPSICPDWVQPLGLLIEVITENCTTNLEPEPQDGLLRLYPNPVAGTLNIRNDAGAVIQNIEISDATGRTVHSISNLPQGVSAIPVEHLEAGIYFLKIKMEGQMLVRKVVKN